MNRLVYSIIIILISVATRTTDGFPGPYLCYYFGSAALTCNGRPVPVSNLPSECTSFIYDGIEIDRRVDTSGPNNGPPPPQPNGSPDQFMFLDAVQQSDKDLLLCFYHAENDKWRYDSEKITMRAQQDAAFIKWYIAPRPKIKGLIFNDIDFISYKANFPLFAQQFQLYLHYMRTAAKDFFIGIPVPAHFLIDEFSNPQSTLKFATFDADVDFYMITFAIFNPCTAKLVKGGVIPYDSDDPEIKYTLKKLEVALKNSGIPSSKLYFKFQLFGISNRTGDLTFYSECFTSYERICKYPDKTISWCADNSGSLRIKGNFARNLGAGFVADSIDLNDPVNSCHCKSPYSSFYYLIDGFKNQQTYPPCALFDRTSIPS
ncbi:Hypothetical protein CINCED_3A001326 [Cinara cedri]|uniref:Glycoside hydrolase superfamily n=1 Tax=Cinara cedri TaxID=506608 RepID=A0A5E4MG39_9HEMI|nr:Hypothetical protein CINCED_3A001326 [Cinara cedri]